MRGTRAGRPRWEIAQFSKTVTKEKKEKKKKKKKRGGEEGGTSWRTNIKLSTSVKHIIKCFPGDLNESNESV